MILTVFLNHHWVDWKLSLLLSVCVWLVFKITASVDTGKIKCKSSSCCLQGCSCLLHFRTTRQWRMSRPVWYFEGWLASSFRRCTCLEFIMSHTWSHVPVSKLLRLKPVLSLDWYVWLTWICAIMHVCTAEWKHFSKSLLQPGHLSILFYKLLKDELVASVLLKHFSLKNFPSSLFDFCVTYEGWVFFYGFVVPVSVG